VTEQGRTVVALIITCLWAAGYIVALITSDYTGVVGASPVMLIAATYFFRTFPSQRGEGKNENK